MNQKNFHSNKSDHYKKLLQFQKIKAEHDKTRKLTIDEFAKQQGFKEFKTKEVNGINYYIFISPSAELKTALLPATKDGPVVQIDRGLVELIVDKKQIGALVLHELGHYFSRHKWKVEVWDIEEQYEADAFVVSKLSAEVLIQALEKIKNKSGHSKEIDLRIKRLKSY
jgi:Zn-dependent protease with chaperone function